MIDVGIGSPTGVRFGTRSHFPPKYQRALFALDWSYGRIFAVHLEPHGASYRGVVETFLRGTPLNLTDLAFGPDGGMYFITGGRNTQSGLYRVSFNGNQPADTAKADLASAGKREAEAQGCVGASNVFTGALLPAIEISGRTWAARTVLSVCRTDCFEAQNPRSASPAFSETNGPPRRPFCRAGGERPDTKPLCSDLAISFESC